MELVDGVSSSGAMLGRFFQGGGALSEHVQGKRRTYLVLGRKLECRLESCGIR